MTNTLTLLTDELLAADEIAKILKVNPRQVSERYSMRPDFPKPIRLPSAKGQGLKRWKRADIMEWINRLQEVS